jgi:hypothetical protein
MMAGGDRCPAGLPGFEAAPSGIATNMQGKRTGGMHPGTWYCYSTVLVPDGVSGLSSGM